MARAINLKSDQELNDYARELGFDPEDVEDFDTDPEGLKDHPISVEDNGDVMRVMTLLSHLEDEVADEEEALEEEIETVKEFREKRIQQKKDSIEFLSMPLQNHIEEEGSNYNGPAGHAGFHTVTTTNWHASEQELMDFALKHNLRVKLTIKAELSLEQLAALMDFVRNCDEDADVSKMPYKSAIKDKMRELGLHGADYTESGEAVEGNPLYELEKRQDFRIKPER